MRYAILAVLAVFMLSGSAVGEVVLFGEAGGIHHFEEVSSLNTGFGGIVLGSLNKNKFKQYFSAGMLVNHAHRWYVENPTPSRVSIFYSDVGLGYQFGERFVFFSGMIFYHYEIGQPTVQGLSFSVFDKRRGLFYGVNITPIEGSLMLNVRLGVKIR